ncbi:MAG: four-helix bundle copper-binding protein [Actinomycetota bacterium]|nr:four-helix bundle copper-binding protein [Actinomycetota bacterium]
MSTTAADMLQTRPWPGHVDRDVLARCIDACYSCSRTCTSCADACLSEEMVAELRKCIRLNLDCADICDATGRVLTRQTEYDAPTSKTQLQACLEICRACAQECESHMDHHDHCRICAEECRRCAEACEALLSAMK